jgi:hypothetical protein
MITLLFAGLASMPCNAEFRDPTQPGYPRSTAAGDNALVLSAIMISSQSRRAIINGVSAKQGQTLVIEQAPAELATSKTDIEDGQLNKAIEPVLSRSNGYANPRIGRPTQENSSAPLLAVASNTQQQPDMAHHPAYPSTIKIISIRKNLVTINQDGEFKTLQLVQRPYKTQ